MRYLHPSICTYLNSVAEPRGVILVFVNKTMTKVQRLDTVRDNGRVLVQSNLTALKLQYRALVFRLQKVLQISVQSECDLIAKRVLCSLSQSLMKTVTTFRGLQYAPQHKS